MANLLLKRQKLARKEHQIKTKLLGLKGSKTYILKRDGRTQSFSILAIFENLDIDFDKYRTSETLSFAALPTDRFGQDQESRTMRQMASIATHIATVLVDGESVVYAINRGDEFQPIYFESVYKFFVNQVSDGFVPEDNP